MSTLNFNFLGAESYPFASFSNLMTFRLRFKQVAHLDLLPRWKPLAVVWAGRANFGATWFPLHIRWFALVSLSLRRLARWHLPIYICVQIQGPFWGVQFQIHFRPSFCPFPAMLRTAWQACPSCRPQIATNCQGAVATCSDQIPFPCSSTRSHSCPSSSCPSQIRPSLPSAGLRLPPW